MPASSSTLVIFGGLVFVHLLFMIISWKFPLDAPDVLPGVEALATALSLSSALWFALALIEAAACWLPRVRIAWRRLLVVLAALTLAILLRALAAQLHEFARL